MIVVDTNVVCYLHVVGEHSAQARLALDKDPEWLAPALWRHEFCNVLVNYLRRNLMSLEDAVETMRQAEALMQGGEYGVQFSSVLELAAGTGCSAYDCELVALASDVGVPLVTVDKRLLAEFPDIAVSLDDFVSQNS